MRRLIIALLFFPVSTPALGQTSKKVSAYLSWQYSQTIYDITVPNNPWGMGLGLQFFFINNAKVKPTVDLTADAYLMDDKVLRLYSDGTPIESVGGMVNLFAGVSYHPARFIYFSTVAGPSFVSGKCLFGLKPTLGFYLAQNQQWTIKVYYINIFNRDKKTNQDFGSIGASIGFKLL